MVGVLGCRMPQLAHDAFEPTMLDNYQSKFHKRCRAGGEEFWLRCDVAMRDDRTSTIVFAKHTTRKKTTRRLQDYTKA